MICVYRGSGPADAWLVKDWLVAHGVRAEVRDHLGGARGELPIPDCWPTVWVRATDKSAAVSALESRDGPQLVRAAWVCSRCAEPNEPAFEWCWSCQTDRTPADDAA